MPTGQEIRAMTTTTMIRPLLVAAVALGAGTALAKLPPPTPEAKAKAAEAAAKSAWSNKVAAYKLCQSMDRVAERYYAESKASGRETHPPTATPPCTDPGPFVYTPPADQNPPIEAAGAHSPPKPAAAPPSTKAPASEVMPTRK
jgi:hypothetical protein